MPPLPNTEATPLTREERDALKELCATVARWQLPTLETNSTPQDVFVVQAREAIPRLLREVERLEEELRKAYRVMLQGCDVLETHCEVDSYGQPDEKVTLALNAMWPLLGPARREVAEEPR